MTDQIETYLREQFDADAQRAPHVHDLAGAARALVRRQRRRNAGAVAAGVAVLALVAGLTYGFSGSTRTAGPPAVDRTTTPSPTATSTPSASPSVAAGTEVLNEWLEKPNGFTAVTAAVPWGGRIYCETVVVSTSSDGKDLYVWALCEQVYAKEGTKATVGSGQSGPLVMHTGLQRRAADGVLVTQVKSIDYPRDQTYREDIDRLFPPDIADQMQSGEIDNKPTGEQLLARAQADVDVGHLGDFNEPPSIAARFLHYAWGESDTLPVDTPVRLYLGNQYKKTIQPLRDGRQSWEVCSSGYAERSCPMSALEVVRGGPYRPDSATAPRMACFAAAGDPPTDTGGSTLAVLVPRKAKACYDDYVVQIWSNDVGQITAVNLLLGSP
jgi:hypothetical protein